MSWLQVVVLSVLQGLTEFLPVSSSGHLAIASRLFFADDAGASFTAVTQLGTEVAVLVYFARDIARIVKAWVTGLFNSAARDADYRLGWYVIIGTIPIGVAGPAVQGRNPHGGKESVADRDRTDRLLRCDRGRRVFRPADPARRTAHLARQRDRRHGPVPGAGAGGVAVRRDDQRGPVPRAGPRAGRPVRLPAGDPGGVRVGVVLVARRVPPGRRGDERQRCPAPCRHTDRVRRRLRGGGLVPAVPGAAQHVLVRRLPGRARRRGAGPARHRGGGRRR